MGRWFSGSVVAAALSVAGCDVTVPGEDGKAQCLDEFLADLGEDRASLEAEAEQRGIEASALLEEMADSAGSLVDHVIDCSASDAMGSLADRTGGTLVQVNTADEVMDEIVSIGEQQPQGSASDLVLLIDATGSMSDDLDAVLGRIDELIASLDGKDARVTAATFRDNRVDDPWYSRDPAGLGAPGAPGLRSFLDQVAAAGGGDLPESLYDGVDRTLDEVAFGGDERTIIAVTDAPPLDGADTQASLDEVAERCTTEGVVVVPILVSLF